MAQKLDRAEFGPNTWLIDEMYRAYLDNPTSVGDAWQEFFADYQPRTPLSEAATSGSPPRVPVPVPAKVPVPSDLVPDGEPAATVVPRRGGAAVQGDRMEEHLALP